MSTFEVIVLVVAILALLYWLYGIRFSFRKGYGVTNAAANLTFLWTLFLITLLIIRVSTLHLLWIFPILYFLVYNFWVLAPLHVGGRLMIMVANIGLNKQEIILKEKILNEKRKKMKKELNESSKELFSVIPEPKKITRIEEDSVNISSDIEKTNSYTLLDAKSVIFENQISPENYYSEIKRLGNLKELLTKANNSLNQKDYQSAIKYALEILDKNIFIFKAHFIAGISYYNLNDFKNAVEQLELFVQSQKIEIKNKRLWLSYYRLAECYYKLEEFKNARECLTTCINGLDPISNDEYLSSIREKSIHLLGLVELDEEDQIQIKYNFLSNFGIEKILPEEDDPLLWNKIFLEFLPQYTDFDFENSTLFFELFNQGDKNNNEDLIKIDSWFIEKTNNSVIEPIKNINTTIKNYEVHLGISTPSSGDDQIVTATYSSFVGKSPRKSITSFWKKDKNEIWHEINRNQIWFD